MKGFTTPEEMLFRVMMRRFHQMEQRAEKERAMKKIMAADPETKFQQRMAVSVELIRKLKLNIGNIYGEMYNYATNGDFNIEVVRDAIEDIYVNLDAMSGSLSGMGAAHNERVGELRQHMALIREALGDR